MFMDSEVGVARTLNRWYRLGHPARIGNPWSATIDSPV